MKFEDLHIFREARFSIGQERDSGKHYLSIPVANRLVDYEEYYELTRAEFDLFTKDFRTASEFADQCRKHKKDDRLFMKPGSDRGVPL